MDENQQSSDSWEMESFLWLLIQCCTVKKYTAWSENNGEKHDIYEIGGHVVLKSKK